MSYSINELRAWVKSVRLKAKPNSIYLVSAQQVEDKLVQMSHKIAELEKERDECAIVISSLVKSKNVDLSDICSTADKSLAIRDLEQQAKGVEDLANKNYSGMTATWMLAHAGRLREQAKALRGEL